MKALKFRQWHRDPVLREVPVPEVDRRLADGRVAGRAVVVPNQGYRK